MAKNTNDAISPEDAKIMVDEMNTPQQFAELLFTKDQVNLILTSDPSEVKDQVLKGQLLTEARVRKVIIEQAKAGSSEAQKQVMKWISEIKLNAILND